MRLFFALWPPAETAASLERWARGVQAQAGGRIVHAARIHLTLVFLGEVPAERLPRAAAAGKRVRFEPREYRIAEARYWPHNRIVWAGLGEFPAAFPQALAHELEAEGFSHEARPFQAHVTLLREARAPRVLPPPPAAPWPVESFTLVHSESSAYRIVETFPCAR